MTCSGEPAERIKEYYDFDPITRSTILNDKSISYFGLPEDIFKGVAVRHYGLPENILEEMKTAGFKIKSWEHENENDDLNAVAVK